MQSEAGKFGSKIDRFGSGTKPNVIRFAEFFVCVMGLLPIGTG